MALWNVGHRKETEGVQPADGRCWLTHIWPACCNLCVSTACVKPWCTSSKMSARGGKKRQRSLSRSYRAGVLFPVGRMERYLRKDTHHYRIGSGAPVYMAAVIEYLTGKSACVNTAA